MTQKTVMTQGVTLENRVEQGGQIAAGDFHISIDGSGKLKTTKGHHKLPLQH